VRVLPSRNVHRLKLNVTASPKETDESWPSEGGVESNGKRTAGPYARNSIRPMTLASPLASGEAETEWNRTIGDSKTRPRSPSKQRRVETRGSPVPVTSTLEGRTEAIEERHRWLETERQEIRMT